MKLFEFPSKTGCGYSKACTELTAVRLLTTLVESPLLLRYHEPSEGRLCWPFLVPLSSRPDHGLADLTGDLHALGQDGILEVVGKVLEA